MKKFFTLIQESPPDTSIRAQSDLLPHVCLRPESPLFAPFPKYKFLPLFEASQKETRYILLDRKGNTWPMNAQEFEEELERLSQDGRYRILKDMDGFQLWERTSTHRS